MIVQNSIPVSRGDHGEHFYIFQGVIKPEILISWVGHDFRSTNWKNLPVVLRELYEKVQRHSAPSRKVQMNGYVVDRMMNKDAMPGLLPAIVMMTEDPIIFTSTYDELVTANPSHDYSSFKHLKNTGRLSIDLSVSRMLIDGLIRATVLANLCAEGVKNVPEIGITIYAPKKNRASVKLFEQCFRDLNSAGTKISAAQAGMKDHSSIFGNIAKDLLSSGILSLPANPNKFAIKEDPLFRLIRATFNGVRQDLNRNFLVSPNIKESEQPKAVAAMSVFLQAFKRELGSDYFFDQKKSAHFFASSLNAIGLTLHHRIGGRMLTASITEIEALATTLARAVDWRRDNPDFVGLVFDTNNKSVANGGAGARMHAYVSEQLRIYEENPN